MFQYAGDDGTTTYRWSRPASPEDPILGRIEASVQAKNDARYTVPLATTAALEWVKTAVAGEGRWKSAKDAIELERDFKVGDQTATLHVTGRLVGKSLLLDVACDQPVVARFDAGGWGPTIRRRAVPVPYLSGMQVHFLPAENLFAAVQLDWTASAATRHENNQAHYSALTDGSRNKLAERRHLHGRLASRRGAAERAQPALAILEGPGRSGRARRLGRALRGHRQEVRDAQ